MLATLLIALALPAVLLQVSWFATVMTVASLLGLLVLVLSIASTLLPCRCALHWLGHEGLAISSMPAGWLVSFSTTSSLSSKSSKVVTWFVAVSAVRSILYSSGSPLRMDSAISSSSMLDPTDLTWLLRCSARAKYFTRDSLYSFRKPDSSAFSCSFLAWLLLLNMLAKASHASFAVSCSMKSPRYCGVSMMPMNALHLASSSLSDVNPASVLGFPCLHFHKLLVSSQHCICTAQT